MLSTVHSLTASAAYFAIVFAAGFALGTLRVLVLIPMTGLRIATLIELPVMLAISWLACRYLVAKFKVPAHTASRLTMGGLAFALLMLGEIGVSVFGFGRTIAQHLAAYHALEAQLGLAAQLVFAAMPWLLLLDQNAQHQRQR